MIITLTLPGFAFQFIVPIMPFLFTTPDYWLEKPELEGELNRKGYQVQWRKLVSHIFSNTYN